MSAECGRSRRTKRASCFRAANRERQPSKKRTHTARHGYASPKPRKSLAEATVTILAVQSNTNLLHRARKLVVCLRIIVRYFLAAQLQYSTFAQHHFLAFPWHCKTTICISRSHSHCCLLQIGPSMCQRVRITMIKNIKQDRPGVRGSCQENGMMSTLLGLTRVRGWREMLVMFSLPSRMET